MHTQARMQTIHTHVHFRILKYLDLHRAMRSYENHQIQIRHREEMETDRQKDDTQNQ